MLCSKLHCQKSFELKYISYKILNAEADEQGGGVKHTGKKMEMNALQTTNFRPRVVSFGARRSSGPQP